MSNLIKLVVLVTVLAAFTACAGPDEYETQPDTPQTNTSNPNDNTTQQKGEETGTVNGSAPSADAGTPPEDADASNGSTTDSGTTDGETPTETKGEIIDIAFDIPPSWEWASEFKDMAILNESGRGVGNSPFAKIEYSGWKLHSEATPEEYANELFTKRKKECGQPSDPCTLQPQLQILQLGDKSVYAVMSEDGYWGDPTWNSVLVYEHENRTVTFWFNEKADLYRNELSTIINSFRFVRE